jgi:hypothetical protein
LVSIYRLIGRLLRPDKSVRDGIGESTLLAMTYINPKSCNVPAVLCVPLPALH